MFFRKEITYVPTICDRYSVCKDMDSHLFNLEVEMFHLQKTIDGLDKRINEGIKKKSGFSKKIIFILIGSLTVSFGSIYELIQIFFR